MTQSLASILAVAYSYSNYFPVSIKFNEQVMKMKYQTDFLISYSGQSGLIPLRHTLMKSYETNFLLLA